MAKGKRKKKKPSHDTCERFQKIDSNGAATKDEENLNITECICFSNAKKRKRLLLCCSRIEACPIHMTSKGSFVKKKRIPKKAKDGASNQPSLAGMIGRWLIKKFTTGHKRGHVPDPIETTAPTNSDEQSMYQMSDQYSNDDEQRTNYDTEPVSWRLPRRLTCKFLTTPEPVQDTVMPLREMCKLALKYRIDRKLHKYRGMDEDNTIKPEVENPIGDNYIVYNEAEPGPHKEATAEPGQDTAECDTSNEKSLTVLSTAEISSEYDDTNTKKAESNDVINIDIVRQQEEFLTAICTDIMNNTEYERLLTSDTELNLAKQTEIRLAVIRDANKLKECLIALRDVNKTNQ